MKIVVAGDNCIDEYIHGTSSRMSPEDPTVPVVKISRIETMDGMSKNVYNNLKAMGASPVLITNSKHPGIVKTRVFSNNKQIARLDVDEYDMERSNEAVLGELKASLVTAEALLIQDYGKGFWNPTTLQILANTSVPVFVDPYSTTPLHYYKGCTAITPNLGEAKALTGKTNIREILTTLIRVTDCKYAIVTLGEDGMTLMEKGNSTIWEFRPKPTQVIDVTGAGDTAIAVIALLYTQGFPIDQCIRAANDASGKTIQKLGVASISKEELESIVQNYNQPTSI